jgi:hypothetical protein
MALVQQSSDAKHCLCQLFKLDSSINDDTQQNKDVITSDNVHAGNIC